MALMNNYVDDMGDKSYLSSEIMWLNKKTFNFLNFMFLFHGNHVMISTAFWAYFDTRG